MGESRWQVHGSTLLTDSAGASGRVHNNTECLSPPSFALLSKHTSYPPQPYHQHTHAHTQTDITFFFFLISMCWCREIAQGTIRDADIQLSTISLAISCFSTLLSLSLLFPLLLSPSLPLHSVSVHISAVLLHYAHSYSCNTHAHAP